MGMIFYNIQSIRFHLMFKEWRTVSYMRKCDMKYDLTSSQAKIIEFLMVGCTDNFFKKLYHKTAAAKGTD